MGSITNTIYPNIHGHVGFSGVDVSTDPGAGCRSPPPPLSFSPHGVSEMVRMGEALRRCQSLGADVALVEKAVRAPFILIIRLFFVPTTMAHPPWSIPAQWVLVHRISVSIISNPLKKALNPVRSFLPGTLTVLPPAEP